MILAELTSLLRQHFFIFYALAWGWVGLVVLASVAYRRAKGRPIWMPHFDGPLFVETWRSGRSLRSAFSRLGGARRCLWVAVVDRSLRVAPHFPFNLMFLPEIYGLEYDLPGDAIRSVERCDGILSENRVRLTIGRANGTEEVFELSLHDPDGFMRAVEVIGQMK